MNIFKLEWWDSQKFFLGSLTVSGFAFILILLNNKIEQACYYTGCMDTYSLIFFFSFLFFSFLFFSFLFLFQENIAKFEKWRRFSIKFLILNAVIILVTPWHAGDAFLGFQRSDVVFLLTGLHFLISWFYLLRKSK